MKQACKHLKVSSILVLVLAAVDLLRLMAALFYGEINSVELPEGSPENILLITKLVLLVISMALTLPRVHVGLKGMRIANHPDRSVGHIVWAIIIFVLAVTNLFSPIGGLIKQEDVVNNVGTLLSVLLEVLVYFDYIRYALIIRKGEAE